MILIFTQYVVPFLAFVFVWGYIALRIHWQGGPAMLVIIFAGILFGPSLLYALIADDSNTALFIISLITALIVVFIVWTKFYHKNEKF
jgi:Na+/proline symporter